MSDTRPTVPVPWAGAGPAPPSAPSAATTLRWVAAGLVAVLLVLVTPLAVAGAWVRVAVFDTERYVATIGPLIEQPAVQQAVADEITDQLVEALDPQSLVDDAVGSLEDALGFLGPLDGVRNLLGSVVETITDVVQSTVADVVASDAFAAAWESANRTAHAEVIEALTGSSDVVDISGGDVSVSADLFLDALRDGLTETGQGVVAGLIPDVDAEFVVLSSSDLAAAQATMRLLDSVGAWVWLVAVAVGVGLVLLAPRRWAGLALAGGAVAAGALLLATAVSTLRSDYLADPDAVLPAEARADLFDQFTSVLSTTSWVLVVLGVVVACAAGAVAFVRSRRPETGAYPVAADAPPAPSQSSDYQSP